MLALLKQFAWFVLKSPQRTVVGFHTLLLDIKCQLYLVNHRLFKKRKHINLTFCIPLYNRTDNFLEYFLKSYLEMDAKNNVKTEIIIADAGSEDINKIINLNLPDIKKIVQESKPFTRAAYVNLAANEAENGILFVCDADISLPKDFLEKVYNNTTELNVWFPICQWQINSNEPTWKWFSAGTGLVAIYKENWQKLGGLNENFTEWGKEDWEFYFRCYKQQIPSHRTKVEGLYHHWHPSLKPKDFINYF